jgi:hypothetical protein
MLLKHFVQCFVRRSPSAIAQIFQNNAWLSFVISAVSLHAEATGRSDWTIY